MKKGGEAVGTYVDEYTAHFGFAPIIETPDAVQLNRIFRLDEPHYRDIVREYLRLNDPFLERNGYSGRMLTGKMVNAIRLKWATTKRHEQRAERNNEYAEKLKQWAIENELHDCIELSPLRKPV